MEPKRCEVFLQAIGNDHPLMNFIYICINNDPQLRPHASEILDNLLRLCVFFTNQMEMTRYIELQEEKRALREEGEEKK